MGSMKLQDSRPSSREDEATKCRVCVVPLDLEKSELLDGGTLQHVAKHFNGLRGEDGMVRGEGFHGRGKAEGGKEGRLGRLVVRRPDVHS